VKIAIRTDSSVDIGSGHVMRCLALAEALRHHGAEITFICRNIMGHYGALIGEKGFPVVMIPSNSLLDCLHDANLTKDALAGTILDWLIVDHYGIDVFWEQLLRPCTKRIMVIDDLANRLHDCDILLDQNLYENLDIRYTSLAPPACRFFLGPRYALLRDEFISANKNLRERDGTIRRILVFFGSSDPTNETEKALAALRLFDRRNISIDVVVGASNPNKGRIQEICAGMPCTSFHCQAGNMASLMANTDLALGAGGSTIWERCFVRLPSIVWTIADNQRETTEAAARVGAVQNLGYCAQVTVEAILSALTTVIMNPAMLVTMGEQCGMLMGHSTGTESIVAALYD
jgi:UDP-2,4-diacetamido-2,4,6-trideoxy-beta-L-altropyranose hydrolase